MRDEAAVEVKNPRKGDIALLPCVVLDVMNGGHTLEVSGPDGVALVRTKDHFSGFVRKRLKPGENVIVEIDGHRHRARTIEVRYDLDEAWVRLDSGASRVVPLSENIQRA